MRSDFGNRLFMARKHAKLTQTQVAAAVGIKQATYSELEKAGQGSSFTPAIADRCGVAVNWLAYGKGEMLQPVAAQSDYKQNHALAQVQQAQAAINCVALLDQVLDSLIAHLSQVDASKRAAVAGVMTALIHDPDDAGMRAALTSMLAPSGFVEPLRKAA